MKILTNRGKDWKKMKMKEKKKPENATNLGEKKGNQSGTERRIQHIKKIDKEKAGMNLKIKKKKGKIGWYNAQIKKSNFFLLCIFEVHVLR